MTTDLLRTWQEVLALDDAALNQAIDTHVYGHVWKSIPKPQAEGWGDAWSVCTDARGQLTYSSVPFFHHTASWERTMDLALRYGIALTPLLTSGAEGREHTQAWVAYGPRHEIHDLSADDPQALRVALCRLALAQAQALQQQKETTP